MGALDAMLAYAEEDDAACPDALVIETPSGVLVHPLPLPGGAEPEDWVAALPVAPEVGTASRWTLAVAPGRSTSFTPTQAWRSVRTA